MRRPLRVGFDLDGVLLYNPVRIVRLPISIVKRLFFKKRHKKFIIPKGPVSKFLWRSAHWTSMFIAPGFDKIETLVQSGKIEAYIITGRYNFLESDFKTWLKKLNRKNIFSGTYINKKNEQPHLFKERMIKDLKLDVFIEDNYDIVEHLVKKTRSRIFWIYNFLDRGIIHPYKFSGLKTALDKITKTI